MSASRRFPIRSESRIYLIAGTDDPLAGKNLITEEDLYGRTLMVGGGSPPALRSVQQRLIATGKINYFNSPDHDTTLTNVAAKKVAAADDPSEAGQGPQGLHEIPV